MRQTSKAQKVSFFVAIVSYIAAFSCILGTIYYYTEIGGENPIVASFAAAVVFFVGAGIVLHVIGRVDLPDLKIRPASSQTDKTDRREP